jgi:hypothetical protein
MSNFPPSVELVTPDGTRTWRLLLQERRESAAPAIANGHQAAPQAEPAPRAPRRRPRHRKPEIASADLPPLDDRVDDLWRDGGDR